MTDDGVTATGDEVEVLRAEVERLRALVGPREASYDDLRDDVAAAEASARAAELELGELRGELAELQVELRRARQDQLHAQRAFIYPVIALRDRWRRLRGR